jgi:hypothetical protein
VDGISGLAHTFRCAFSGVIANADLKGLRQPNFSHHSRGRSVADRTEPAAAGDIRPGKYLCRPSWASKPGPIIPALFALGHIMAVLTGPRGPVGRLQRFPHMPTARHSPLVTVLSSLRAGFFWHPKEEPTVKKALTLANRSSLAPPRRVLRSLPASTRCAWWLRRRPGAPSPFHTAGPEAEQVGARIQLFAPSLLRRHVGHSAHRGAGVCQAFGINRQSGSVVR